MKPCASYVQLLLSLICAHTLLYFTFDNTSVFWYLYTASMLFCISFAIGIGKLSSKYNNVSLKNILLGIGTGAALFAFFYVSMQLMDWLHLSSLTKDVSRLYKIYQPELVFHYIVLFLIIIPSEEIFWRGYIQTKLSEKFRALISIPLSVLMYALPLLYAQNTALLLAGIFAGLVWSLLFHWKKSLSLVITSHLVFDLLLIVIFPLL